MYCNLDAKTMVEKRTKKLRELHNKAELLIKNTAKMQMQIEQIKRQTISK